MKLLTKTTLYYLLFTVPLLLLSGWFLFHNIEKSLQEEIDEELQNSKALWLLHVDKMPVDADLTLLNNPFIEIERSAFYADTSVLTDTVLYQPIEKELVPFRNLTTYLKRNGQSYKISFQRSVLERDDVFQNLGFLMSIVFGGLLLLFLLINLYINKKLWKPFNTALVKITSLDMQHLQDMHFEKTSVREFNALNTSLNAMTEKMQADYLSMKTFTQNASHEIQTPLAVIQSKLELLLQDSKLTEEQANIIGSASEATQRLSKLNQALLLITKIENNQFKASGTLSIESITKKYISFFAELMEQQQLVCSLEVEHDWQLELHGILADMLVSNFLSNAIKYNRVGGTINIRITQKSFTISNTSSLPKIEEDILFSRFSKQDATVGNGLGLAIVKEICDSNGLQINYRFENNHHQFNISQ